VAEAAGASALGSADGAAWAGWNPQGKAYDYINPDVKERLSDQSLILRWREAGIATGRAAIAIAAVRARMPLSPALR
jgi:hypothetical protein